MDDKRNGLKQALASENAAAARFMAQSRKDSAELEEAMVQAKQSGMFDSPVYVSIMASLRASGHLKMDSLPFSDGQSIAEQE